jgi:hypothetical protein
MPLNPEDFDSHDRYVNALKEIECKYIATLRTIKSIVEANHSFNVDHFYEHQVAEMFAAFTEITQIINSLEVK